MAFISSLLGYVGNLIFLVVLAVLGIFVGKKLRDRKDVKTALEENDAKIKE